MPQSSLPASNVQANREIIVREGPESYPGADPRQYSPIIRCIDGFKYPGQSGKTHCSPAPVEVPAVLSLQGQEMVPAKSALGISPEQISMFCHGMPLGNKFLDPLDPGAHKRWTLFSMASKWEAVLSQRFNTFRASSGT